jgi:MoaA/NifB/PqqE/SkfB family radical SAM enzyme
MKRLSMLAKNLYSFKSLVNVRRRQGWFVENLTARKFANLLIASAQFLLKHEVMKAWPVIVKIDISPLCNLQCTVCVHASPTGDARESLKAQVFSPDQKMSLNQFKRIIAEVSGNSLAVSMYYLGDPLVHPDLDVMCTIARQANLNSHISTNFSFNLSDERIRNLVTSGLTHLTVCVDGFTQETYERTRVGGRLDVVLDNLRRVVQCRSEIGGRYPRIEVQFIKYRHNLDELNDALRYFSALGVDQVTDYWGALHNYTDFSPGKYRVLGPRKNKLLPQCLWPHFSLQIKFNGDVIPCCNYRHGSQYDRSEDKRIVGNVLKSGLWNIWNSVEYQDLRRFVSNPRNIVKEANLAKTFCDGCPTIFDTEVDKKICRADQHHWEDFYKLDSRKHVVQIRSREVNGNDRRQTLL